MDIPNSFHQEQKITQFDKSAFILYEYSNSPQIKMQIKSLPNNYHNNFNIQCYLLLKTDLQTIIDNYNTILNPKTSSFTMNSSYINRIIYKAQELLNLPEFCIVKKEFLNLTGNKRYLFQKQKIYFYQNGNKVYLYFPEDPNGQNIIEIIDMKIKDNNDININNITNPFVNSANVQANTQKQKIVKKSLLLIAFERDLLKLIERPIDDEYNDIKEYYLINRNWINLYQNKYSILFNNIKQWLNNINNTEYKYLYNYFYYNIDESYESNEIKNLIDSINNISMEQNLLLEDNFYPYFNRDNEFNYPIEFFIVPESLFDLFYEDISKVKYNKKDYKITTLIGENVLFIQDKTNNNIVYTYAINDNNKFLQLYCILSYNKKDFFFQDVKTHIKGKDFSNYLLVKNVNINSNQKQPLIDEQTMEGTCVIKSNCPKVFIEKFKIKKEIKIIMELYKNYINFIEQMKTIMNYNYDINNINDLLRHNIQTLQIIITSKQEMDTLKEKLHFTDLENISKITNDYSKIEEFLINKLNNQQSDLKNYIPKINLVNEANIDYIIKNNNNDLFSFINLDLIQMIYNSQQQYAPFLKNFFNSAFLFFKNFNKNGYYIINKKIKRLFKLLPINKTEFKIEEFNSSGNNKNMIELLKNWIKLEKKINEKFQSPLKYISEPTDCYLVNKIWINTFKKIFSFDYISNHYNYDDETLNKTIKFNKDIPNELKLQNNLYHQNMTIANINMTVPSNFEIVETGVFDLILKEINIKFNTFLKLDKQYKISFGDKKIFINDSNNNKLYLIYSFRNNNFDLDYIIQIKNFSLFNLLSSYAQADTLEQCLIYNFGLNLKETKPQIILTEEFENIGNFLNIKPKLNLNVKEPKHCLGLENIGATCYMNATIQCLCNVYSLKKYFLCRQLIYKDIANKNCELTLEFYNVINNLWKESYHGKKYYTPRKFKDKISTMNPLFQGIAANDSKDLIIFLFETMHSELNTPDYQNLKGQNVINNQILKDFRNDYYSKNSSIFSKTFYFEQQSELKCLNCGYNKLSYTIYNIIIFPLEKVREYMAKKHPYGFEKVKLEDCFENYQEEEILCGNNQIYCNQCRLMSNASNSNKIYNLPEVMTIILNRGKGLEFDVNFEYPLKLNVDKYVLDNDCKDNNYELICVLSHIGPSGMAGHFIAFCKSPTNGKWYIYNDAQINECHDPRYPNDDMIEGLPYVLFYQKCNINKEKQGNDFDINSFNIENYNFNNDNIISNSDKITLYFKYEDKEGYIDTERNKKISHLINELNRKYEISKNSQLFLEEYNGLTLLENYKKVEDYPNLKNGSRVVVVAN